MADNRLGDVAGKYSRLTLPRLPGYQRVPGKSQRHRGPNGVEISDRQYKTIQREQALGVRQTQEQYRNLRVGLPSTMTVQNEFAVSWQKKMAKGHRELDDNNRWAKDRKGHIVWFDREDMTIGQIKKDARFRQLWESWKIARHRSGPKYERQRRTILETVNMLQNIGGKWVYVLPR